MTVLLFTGENQSIAWMLAVIKKVSDSEFDHAGVEGNVIQLEGLMVKSKTRRRLIYAMVLGTLMVASCTFWDVPEGYWEGDPVWSPDGRHIAFECYYGKPDLEGLYSDMGYEICVIGSDGTGYRRLTTNNGSDRYPTWSPDGRRIAFASGGFTETIFTEKIMVVDPDGSHLVELTGGKGSLSWSPDGRSIAYRDAAGNLALVSVESGTSITLSTTGDKGDDFRPVWSPDGQRIAFTSNRDGHEEVYVVNADSTGETRLTHGPTHSNSPAWSPDGKHIAFISLKDSQPGTGTGYWALEMIEPDAGNRVQLTHRDADQISWAPDGQHIVFSSHYDSTIFMINVDTSTETQLSSIPRDEWLSISPNGQRAAVVRKSSGSLHTERIWIVNMDGSGEIKLTQQ